MRRAAIVSLILIGAILGGCASAPVLRPSSVKGKGELRVQVFDRETGDPLKETTISLLETDRSVETDANGVAVIADLDSGTYSLSISHSWFRTIKEPDYEVRANVVTELVYKMESNDRLGE